MIKLALIPSFEPDAELPLLMKKLSDAGFERIVVDDGSGDSARALYRQMPPGTILLKHEKNRGKGCALKTGLSYIRDHYPSDAIVVTLDADGQHCVPDTVRCAAAAAEHPDCLILGCRTLKGRQVPLRSRFGNAVTRMVYRLSSGTSVSDTQTGLRSFQAALIPFLLAVAGERYEYEMNVLLECPKRQIPLWEVPIATVYQHRNAGSHFRTFRDSYRIYGEILHFAGSSFLGFLVDYSLYSLLVTFTMPWGTFSVPFSNVAARIVSAAVNFSVNRRFVFHNRESVVRTGSQYFLLAACILCGNTFLLSWLVNDLGVNRFSAKLVTEATFFLLSWLFQRLVIFREKKTRT